MWSRRVRYHLMDQVAQASVQQAWSVVLFRVISPSITKLLMRMPIRKFTSEDLAIGRM